MNYGPYVIKRSPFVKGLLTIYFNELVWLVIVVKCNHVQVQMQIDVPSPIHFASSLIPIQQIFMSLYVVPALGWEPTEVLKQKSRQL